MIINGTTEMLRELNAFQVRRVLLVASLYDFFILEEDGRLADLLGQAYTRHDLGYVPSLRHVSGGQAALEAIQAGDFDLVVTIMRLGDMDPFTFGRRVKELRPGMPVVLLAFNTPELDRLVELADPAAVDRIFVWQGDGKILVGIIEYIEDQRNAAADTRRAGVQNLLVIEDSPLFYSMYLPLLFEELWGQTDRLLQEDLTFTQRSLRQKARPKVHLATTYEEALAVYEEFKDHLLGIITDMRFPRAGTLDPAAGLDFVTRVRGEQPDLPVLIQSSEDGGAEAARQLGVGYLLKSSKTLFADFQSALRDQFGFGDLVLRDAGGQAVQRISNLPMLLAVLDNLSEGVLRSAVSRGELRRWLLARTELAFAARLADPAVRDCADESELRRAIHRAWADCQRQAQQGGVVRYSRKSYEGHHRFMRLGGGSIGGKARGLAFIDQVLTRHIPEDRFPDVTLAIPKTLVIGTDVFDAFIRENNLLEFAAHETSDRRIASRFLQSDLPATLVGDLRNFIQHVRVPLAVRSSSLLEDALYQPFAGIYATKMIPNHHKDVDTRFRDLTNAIKLVWASTFFRGAKAYIESTNHRIEEEKMAVIIQEVVGRLHKDRFYPDISGVGCSYNYYPTGYAKPQDGVVLAALGLGKTVVDGGTALRFCPAHPKIIPQFATIPDMLDHSQNSFWAINMQDAYTRPYDDEDQFLTQLPLSAAEQDGTLAFIGSTYSRRDDRVYDGIRGDGPRIVTFAHILKREVFPLAKILRELLALASDAMGCAIEMEFAVTLDPENALPARFGFLQVRPMVVSDELVEVELAAHDPAAVLLRSSQVLGNGVNRKISDIVFVHPDGFDAAHTPAIAREVDQLNGELRAEGRPYLLIGPGRWGSTDSWLGIPVNFGQINGAKVIVEIALPQMNVDPSQGSHFFQNLTSLRIGYFTVPLHPDEGFIDWDWLKAQSPAHATEHLRHLRLEQPLEVRIDGRIGRGVVLKPTPEPAP